MPGGVRLVAYGRESQVSYLEGEGGLEMCYIQGMSSCAVQEICYISDDCRNAIDSGKAIMMAFCKQTLGMRPDVEKNGGYALNNGNGNKPNGNIGSYTEGLGESYIFHGVEGYGSKPPTKLTAYASKFAQFITDNKLGSVVGGEVVNNHRFHPENWVRVYIFNPDREAVKKWWSQNGGPDYDGVKVAKKSVVLAELADNKQAEPNRDEVPF